MTRTRTLLGLTLVAAPLFAQVRINQPAPDFHGTDSNGKPESLGQYKGKYIVLEWANQGCLYEQKHYNSGNMERLQKQWTAKGVVWLSVLSSAPGEQGNVTPSEENDYLHQMHAAPTAAILDPVAAPNRALRLGTRAESPTYTSPGRSPGYRSAQIKER